MKSQAISTLVVLGCIVAVVFYACRPDWQFAHLERNARKVITPDQLQAWAMQLLAAHPTNDSLRVSELGTNFPPQLLGVYHLPPDVSIRAAGTNSPGSVFLMWGGGLIGHCGFEVGPTGFVCYREHARAWQPGVYFWSDRP